MGEAGNAGGKYSRGTSEIRVKIREIAVFSEMNVAAMNDGQEKVSGNS